jgi:hypothetical protein
MSSLPFAVLLAHIGTATDSGRSLSSGSGSRRVRRRTWSAGSGSMPATGRRRAAGRPSLVDELVAVDDVLVPLQGHDRLAADVLVLAGRKLLRTERFQAGPVKARRMRQTGRSLTARCQRIDDRARR